MAFAAWRNAQDSSGNTIWQNVTGNGGAPLDPQEPTDPSLAITHQNFTNYGFQFYTVTNNSIIITSYLYNADANIWSLDSYLINLSYYSDFATNRNAMTLAHLLDSTDGNGTDFANLLTALANLSDADVGNALNALLPVVDGSVLEVTKASFDKFMSTFSILDASRSLQQVFRVLYAFLGIFGSLALIVASIGMHRPWQGPVHEAGMLEVPRSARQGRRSFGVYVDLQQGSTHSALRFLCW